MVVIQNKQSFIKESVGEKKFSIWVDATLFGTNRF